MTNKTKHDLSAIREAYERSPQPVSEINAQYGCNASELAGRYGWIRRRERGKTTIPAPDCLLDFIQYRDDMRLCIAKINEWLPLGDRLSALQILEGGA